MPVQLGLTARSSMPRAPGAVPVPDGQAPRALEVARHHLIDRIRPDDPPRCIATRRSRVLLDNHRWTRPSGCWIAPEQVDALGNEKTTACAERRQRGWREGRLQGAPQPCSGVVRQNGLSGTWVTAEPVAGHGPGGPRGRRPRVGLPSAGRSLHQVRAAGRPCRAVASRSACRSRIACARPSGARHRAAAARPAGGHGDRRTAELAAARDAAGAATGPRRPSCPT